MAKIHNYTIDELQEVIETCNSKTDIFKKLECSRNNNNITYLNNIIKENNFVIGKQLEKTLHTNNICHCKYCNKEYSQKGIYCHELYCKMNPNRQICKGNNGATKGYTAWNKDLTKYTDSRVLQQSINQKEKYKINGFKSHKQTKETRLKISNSIKKYHEQYGNPGFCGIANNKISYPEQYFLNIFQQENIPLLHHLQVGPYELDFYNSELKKYIEIDGEQHYRFEENIIHDKKRDEYFSSIGWTGMRIRWSVYKKMSYEEQTQLIQKIKVFLC